MCTFRHDTRTYAFITLCHTAYDRPNQLPAVCFTTAGTVVPERTSQTHQRQFDSTDVRCVLVGLCTVRPFRSAHKRHSNVTVTSRGVSVTSTSIASHGFAAFGRMQCECHVNNVRRMANGWQRKRCVGRRGGSCAQNERNKDGRTQTCSMRTIASERREWLAESFYVWWWYSFDRTHKE